MPRSSRDLTASLLRDGELLTLNPDSFPGCHLSRSNPSDVARVEHLTFICTPNKEDAGPNNNWMDPTQAHAKMRELFRGCMKNRTLYVVPYCMGPTRSSAAVALGGVEITDSPYVVLNMAVMTRMGRMALERIAREGTFVRGLQYFDRRARSRAPFHHRRTSRSRAQHRGLPVPVATGGNALLVVRGADALRIASWQARSEGWLAEHMLIVGLQSPKGETHYIACAFPSACGKTNLAMLIPPASLPGWKSFHRGR